MECFKDLIGLTENYCECLIGQLTEDEKKEIMTSASGLYLDTGLNGVINLRAMSNQKDCKNLAKKFIDAKEAASRNVYDDIMTAIESKYTSTGKGYSGSIGKDSYSGTLEDDNTYHFMKLEALKPSDAVIYLQRARVAVNKQMFSKIYVLRSEKGSNEYNMLGSWGLETSMNAFTSVEINIALPITEEGITYNYYIGYGLPEGIRPKDNKTDCNCGQSRGYLSYFNVSGLSNDTFNDLNNVKTTSSAHGIVLDLKVKCEGGNIICKQYNDNDAIARTLANAFMYKVGVKLLDSILASDDVQRFVTIKKEYLLGKIKHFNYEYNVRILAIKDAIDINASDCFICKQRTMRKTLM